MTLVSFTQKYLEVGYPICFIRSIINNFKSSKEEEQLIIPEWLFDQRKKVFFKLPYCPSNERDVKRFIDKIEGFINGKLKFIVLWSTRTIKSLFALKDQVKHLPCVIYEGKCPCGRRYKGETIRNSDIRWNEQDSITCKSEPAKHFADNKSHMFTWKVLASTPLHFWKRKILEVFFITKLKRNLNDQIEHHVLSLFRHEIT